MHDQFLCTDFIGEGRVHRDTLVCLDFINFIKRLSTPRLGIWNRGYILSYFVNSLFVNYLQAIIYNYLNETIH